MIKTVLRIIIPFRTHQNVLIMHLSLLFTYVLVLSAGYDGDDNEDEYFQNVVPDLFGDQPLKPPDVLMHGMSTPPSTLTIDDSDATYAR